MVKAFGTQITGSDFVRVRVPNVKINGQVKSVKFVAREKHVTCSTRGESKIRVTVEGNQFRAQVRGTADFYLAKSPAAAFARAAQIAWA